jgi:hypothetical protein
MTIRTVVTNTSTINALPVPGVFGAKSDDQQLVKTLRSDAAIAVAWLNAALDANKKMSYSRVTGVREQLEKLQRMREQVVQRFGPESEAWNAALRRYEQNRAALKSAFRRREKPPIFSSLPFPADRRSTPRAAKDYNKLIRAIERSTDALNQVLAQYSFRPQVAYFRPWSGASVLQHDWAGGMFPDVDKRWFKIQIGDSTISEGDAVLALVRLHLANEGHKVTLCEECRKRWRVVAKSHYRFCSDRCRGNYYAKSPDYHDRKAKNQARYRANNKRARAAGLA